MMLNDFTTAQQCDALREDERNRLVAQMNSNLYSATDTESIAHLDSNSSNTINSNITSSNSASSSSKSNQQVEHIQQRLNANLHNNIEQQQQQQQQFDHRHQNQSDQRNYHSLYFTSSNPQLNSDYSTDNNSKFDSIRAATNSLASSPLGSLFNTTNKTRINQTSLGAGDMNVNTNQHSNMIPTAHGSGHQMLYSQPTPKNLPVSSTSSMALNFSHDLLQQTSNHHILGSGGMHQHSDNNIDTKPQLHNSFEIDSRSLMQSAVGINMWKDSMSQLNHFKHPAIAEHSFLPASDLNSFPNWNHGNNLNHQSSNMTQNIMDNQHLMVYSQHQQRSMPNSNEDLGGSLAKVPSTVEQTSFMLNSISHKASTSQNSSSNHQTTQPLDNLNLRSDSLDNNASSYNLSINDNHLYTGSRSESRSHPNINKTSFMSDRSVNISNHQGQLQSNENMSLQQVAHLVPSSSFGPSKNTGSFRCPHCSEVFPLRTVYQSHLKTHSQEKGSKAKFQCDLCGHSFSQKTSLNRHMKSHTGERPFPCEICAKAFSEKERLKIHMRTHTGEKPFSCQTCGKSFSQKSTVKRHQTVHTGEKKFRCDCGKGFANRGNLIAHIKTRGSNHFE